MGHSHIVMVAEYHRNYCTTQFKHVKVARKLYNIIRAPSKKNYMTILCWNRIRDCPVVEKDIDLAEAIFGPDISTLKGKTDRRTLRAILQDLIAVPPELKKHSIIELYIDVVYVNGIGFLTSIGYLLFFGRQYM